MLKLIIIIINVCLTISKKDKDIDNICYNYNNKETCILDTSCLYIKISNFKLCISPNNLIKYTNNKILKQQSKIQYQQIIEHKLLCEYFVNTYQSTYYTFDKSKIACYYNNS